VGLTPLARPELTVASAAAFEAARVGLKGVLATPPGSPASSLGPRPAAASAMASPAYIRSPSPGLPSATAAPEAEETDSALLEHAIVALRDRAENGVRHGIFSRLRARLRRSAKDIVVPFQPRFAAEWEKCCHSAPSVAAIYWSSADERGWVGRAKTRD
jgi:hypothetical protein